MSTEEILEKLPGQVQKAAHLQRKKERLGKKIQRSQFELDVATIICFISRQLVERDRFTIAIPIHPNGKKLVEELRVQCKKSDYEFKVCDWQVGVRLIYGVNMTYILELLQDPHNFRPDNICTDGYYIDCQVSRQDE